MGVRFNPKKSIAAFSKSFVKTVCVANGIDINTADAIASASGGLIEGFSYEKTILPPNSKLYKLVSTSVVDSLKKNKLESSKELREKIVVNVFSLNNLLTEAAMEKILKSAELYLTCTEKKLKSVVQEILIAIEDGIKNDADLILLENSAKLDEVLKILRNKHVNDTFEEYNDGSKTLIENFMNVTWGKLALKDTYISNNYRFPASETDNSDLLCLIEYFIENKLYDYIHAKGESLEHNIRSVFITGYQGVGKSSLLSKIAYEHSFNGYLSEVMLSFISSKKVFNSNFDINTVCKHDEKRKSVLFVDALDESNLSELECIDRVNDLIDLLCARNCKLVVTCRHNFISTRDIKMTLEVVLQPFSMEQTRMWVNNYCSIHSSVDNKYIDNLLLSIHNGANEVVRIPYILYTCIERKVDFTKVSHPKDLYDALFCGVNARSAITEYNQYPRYSSKEWCLYEDKIDEIALAIYHSSEYTISREQLKKIIGNDSVLVSQFATEFFLKRVGDSYKFIHNSIYEYFIAKKITSYVDELLKSNNTELFLKQMDSIIGRTKTINFSLLEFISHFIKYNSSSVKIEDIIIDVLKSSTRVYFKTRRNESIFEILEKLQSRFVIIMSVFAEYIKKHCKVTNLLQNLSEDELSLFVRFTNFHEGSFTFVRSFNLDNVELNNINLSGTNLSSLAIDGLKLKDANLKGTSFVGSYMHNFTATNTDMRETNCKNADFNGCVLIGSDLRGSRLNGANLYCGNLMLTDLRGATFIKTNLNGVNFFNCKISVEQLAFIHLDVVIRFNINVYDGEKLLKIKDVIEYYKEKHPVRYMFNYYDSPLLPHSL